MDDAQTATTPWHLWVVGLLALLLNAFGCTDYTMTRLHNMEWLSMGGGDPEAMLAWIDSFPIYAQFGWGLGVWMGLIGCVLLLMRHRWSVPVLGLSVLGALLGLGYQIIAAPPLPGTEGNAMMTVMPYVIIAVAIGLFLYGRAMSNKGLLK